MERRDRNREGGGVCVFVRDDIAFNVREDLNHQDIEAIWVDVLLPRTKPILICICYRPPKQTNFYSLLEEHIISSEKFQQQEIYMLGDFNTNYLKDSKDTKSNSLLRTLKHYMSILSLKQIITEPTRVSQNCSSTIDLILTSEPYKISQHGVISVGLSDHDLIYCTSKISKDQINKHNTAQIRSLKNYDKVKFIEKLNKADWFKVINEENINIAWSNFKFGLNGYR